MGVQISLFYNSIQNIFVDGDGFIVYNIHEFVTPNHLLLFKKRKKDVTFKKENNVISLYWTDYDGLFFTLEEETNKVGEAAYIAHMERIIL